MVGLRFVVLVLVGLGWVVCCSCSMVAMSRAIAHLWCQRQQLGSCSSRSARSQICLSSVSSFGIGFVCFVCCCLLLFVLVCCGLVGLGVWLGCFASVVVECLVGVGHVLCEVVFDVLCECLDFALCCFVGAEADEVHE